MEVHRYWSGDETPPAEPWLTHVLVRHGYTIKSWSDDNLPKNIIEFVDRHAHRSEDIRHRANLVRWSLLRDFGGMWLDYDMIPLGILPEGPWTASTLDSRSSAAVCLPANHELAVAICERIDSTDNTGPSPYVSGDSLLNELAPDQMERLPILYDALGRQLTARAKFLHLWANTSLAVRRRPTEESDE